MFLPLRGEDAKNYSSRFRDYTVNKPDFKFSELMGKAVSFIFLTFRNGLNDDFNLIIQIVPADFRKFEADFRKKSASSAGKICIISKKYFAGNSGSFV